MNGSDDKKKKSDDRARGHCIINEGGADKKAGALAAVFFSPAKSLHCRDNGLIREAIRKCYKLFIAS